VKVIHAIPPCQSFGSIALSLNAERRETVTICLCSLSGKTRFPWQCDLPSVCNINSCCLLLFVALSANSLIIFRQRHNAILFDLMSRNILFPLGCNSCSLIKRDITR